MSDDWRLLPDDPPAATNEWGEPFDGPPCEWCEGDSAQCDCHNFICEDCGEIFPRIKPNDNETRCADCFSLKAIADREQGDPHERNGGRIP